MSHFFHPRKRALISFSRLIAGLFVLVMLFSQWPILVAQADGTDLSLTKTIEGNITTAQVGDVLRYRIHFACSNLTTPCGDMVITDVLQPGLIYQPPPASSVPAGFSIAYNSASNTITITKDDHNLLDGSQYDAVIAVQVDYDLRPLPAVINNTVNGQIDPTRTGAWESTDPASAPPVTIGTVTPSWALTKSLVSPTINPTVDTDVTYQIQLCPAPSPSGQGNVPLTNVTFTDTLPTGATFVSASDGGAESGGVVTWPTVPGPIYPTGCISRYVTIRYDSGTFNVGDPVTNTASAGGQYVDSTGTIVLPGGLATDPITHDIDPIHETPNYSKSDTGDPIGLTGTGRFLLNLDTNSTNYPSNDLILVDNLPPQLQVDSVTSGQWPAAFDYVRAYVEYSTNNGGSYVAFPGQPVSYGTNATYTAPATNITNVRWRFEFDPDKTAPFDYSQPGLPYTWSFTTAPEIRVTPRAVPTPADPPSGATLPAAIVNSTYDNCLQVTRTSSSGAAVSDPCAIEALTVAGTYVSLRTSKTETPGSVWDDLSDPLINTFVSDATILPGDTMKYTITIEVTERSSEALVNPTIQDTLPPAGDFVFVRNGTARLDGAILPAAQQPTFSQVGQTLTWTWNNPSPAISISPLSLGSRFLTVEFYGRIPRGQRPETYTNDLFAVTDSSDVLCEIGVAEQDSSHGDIDGDADATDPGCRNPDTYVVERSAALRGEKWIRSTDAVNSQVVDASTFLPSAACPDGGAVGLPGEGSNPFTRYPCIAQAFPEGALSPGQYTPPPSSSTIDDFEYNLRIFNDGNVPMLSYVLYDILPYVGDTGSGGVLSTAARNSEFRPLLRGPVAFIRGDGLSAASFTIEYNLSTNPCRPEVFDQPVGASAPAGCNNVWTPTWTSDARSFRIRLNTGAYILPTGASDGVRFGVPMYIPEDAPPVGFDVDNALSREIAWNSFSHVGAYDSNTSSPPVVVEDLLASEPRKVGITVPERMSVGNRVWRDADNSGTINAPDDLNPGIDGVTVNLYRDTTNDGLPDGVAIATTTTDDHGFYLFSNIPYDTDHPDNNRYIIGIPASNFGAGQPLESLRSSTGTPASTTYTNPPANTVDRADDGIDPAAPGAEVLSASFILQPTTEPTGESDLSSNDRDGLLNQRRGVNGERDENSDLTIDFGFFGGSDFPFSIGNQVWKDNGENGAIRNDGIRQSTEPPAAGVRVQLYRDGNADGVADPTEMIRWDVTDANGYYLFDNLDPGHYFVEVAAVNFTAGQPLAGWYSSQPPAGTETTGVNGGTTTADLDNDDNGVNNNVPESNGIFSGVVILERGASEPEGEADLSGDTSIALGFDPTAGDGPASIGRFGETDTTSNMTIDFGFIPPMSLGNRVWIDEGAGTLPFRSGYNNGLMDGAEVGVSGVTVQLWRDTDGTPGLQIASDTLMYSAVTDSTGYYLFDRLQPGDNYYVHIPAVNFNAGRPLRRYLSSTDAYQSTAPADDFEDSDDDGIDSTNPVSTGISSPVIAMAYGGEPLTPANESDVNTSGVYGPQNRGNFGQEDGDSNLTIDFGFARPPRSLGNRLWMDNNNNAQVDAGELPVPTGVRVSLYLDANADGQPDDLGITGDRTDDAIAYDLTDANGYYLFDDLPPNNYIVGVDRANFAAGGLLEGYNSSKGSVDNATNNTDSLDNGVDRLQRADPGVSPHGILSTRINLTATPVNAPTTETGSGDTSILPGFNPTAGDGPASRGRFGEINGNSDLTIDFGFFIPMSLGNRVFLDDGAGGGVYNNGIMDGGELALANVLVELYQDANQDGVPDGALIASDITDAGGYYLFDDLAQGSYVVVVAAANFSGAGPLVGYNTSLPTGSEDAGVAGNPYTPGTDRDDNGVNVGTPELTGVRSGTIVLALNTEPTTESELSGESDPGGAAALAFSPTGWDGPVSRGRWEESDVNSNLTVDFGFIPVFSLGNRVWFDTNNNSLFDSGEMGVDNVNVRLMASDGVTEILVGPDGILNTSDDAAGGVFTAGGGYYLFNNLPAGDYVVALSASNFIFGGWLAGYWSSATSMDGNGVISETTAALANSDNDADDNGTFSGGLVISSPVSLGPAITSEPGGETDLNGGQGQPDRQANMTVDFGFYRVEIGNLVYLDQNANGNYDGASDTVVSNAVVKLYAANGADEILVGPDGALGTLDDAAGGMTTNGVGFYLFANLPAGSYVVKATAPSGTASTIDTFDSADNAGPAANTDDNDNGIGLSSGETPSGVFALTPGATGAKGNNVVTNASGTTYDPTIDFGFVGQVAIGNRVWFDDGLGGGGSNNGHLDGTEVGVGSVVVNLYTSAGSFVSSTTTDSTGHYQFDALYPGVYYVQIPASEFQTGKPLLHYFSSVGSGTDETTDETADENGIDDANPALNGIRSMDYTLTPGSELTGEDQSNYTGALPDNSVNFTVDFGFTQKYALGNRVWFDTNNNSSMDPGEVGIDGVRVDLYAAGNLNAILATEVTASGGYYLFDALYPGDYVVSVADSNFATVLNGYWSSATTISPTGIISETTAALADGNADLDDNGTLQTGGALNGAVIASLVTLGPSGDTEPVGESDVESNLGQGEQADGRANMTVDFGFYTQTLGNLVWSDTDQNGAFNGSENGIDGLTVDLWSADGSTQLDSVNTAGGGLYSFPGLPQGDYTVRVTAPMGTVSSVDSYDPTDSSFPSTNTDDNDNGVGVGSGVVISNPVTLTPGLAQVSNTVENASGSTVNPSIDFGFTPVFALGNRVWFDTDNSSDINGAEVGIDGVSVSLYAASDLTTALATQTTINGGYYLFNGLQAGDYVVAVDAANFSGVLSGYWSSGAYRDTAGAAHEAMPTAAESNDDSDDNGMLQSGGDLDGAVVSSVVTLGPETTVEPAGETDLDGGNQGQPDTQANMTVDFGFYTITLGNLVWNDQDNSGVLDVAEAGMDGVTVDLYSGDGALLLASTTTGGGGIYTFSGLPAGDVVVRLRATNFNPGGVLRDFRSSTGPLPGAAYEPAPDADADVSDSDDNGAETGALLGLGGWIETLPVTLTPAGEQTFDDATGQTTEYRVDFGVNNAPQIDLAVTKTDNQLFYVAGGTLNYVVTVTNNGPADAIGMLVSDPLPAQITSWTWTCAPGTLPGYNCSDAASNSADFSDTLDLPQLASVTYNVSAQVSPTATGTLSNIVTVTPPDGLTDMTPADNGDTDADEQAALEITKDDGLSIVAPDFTTTYTIIVTNHSETELTGIALVDTVPAGMTFVAASAGGAFNAGQITWPLFDLAAGGAASFTVQLKVADLASLGTITTFTNAVHARDDGTHTGGTPVEGDAEDTDLLAGNNTKSLVSTDQAGSATPNVFIGEILTYTIQIDLPVGVVNHLQAVDVLGHGLAFVGCAAGTPITTNGLTLEKDPCTMPAALKVESEPVSGATSEDAGRRITFDFGQVENTTATPQTLVVSYQVIVLDILDNANDVQHTHGLNNAVTWSWEGGSLTGEAPKVYVVEPDLAIIKTVDPQVASIGSTVTFTIHVEHTSDSAAPAYDVRVIDKIPTGLAFVTDSAAVNGSAGLAAPTMTTTATSLNVFWASFPLGASADVTFQAKFTGPGPVINLASVDWSSIPVDPAPALKTKSPYNDHSTERRYDPGDDTVNDYRRTSNATLRRPALPETGFAPGIQTVLEAQPLAKQYSATDVVLEIPGLGIKIPVVGVPFTGEEWDVSWLGGQAGWLAGTAFPSWNGNSVVTGHVYDNQGLAGPFVHLGQLKYGDQIVVHAYGQKYTFEVRTNEVVAPQDISAFKHEDQPWLTLVTCKEYDPLSDSYFRRVVVRAVLTQAGADR